VFLPLDPGTPAERVGFCCADAAVRHAITGTGDRGPLPAGVSVLAVPTGAPAPAEEPADLPPAGPADPAYLIYTSGSTGTPKGVLVGRAALANLVGWHLSALELTAADRSVLFASPAFDVSIGEIWPGLVAGASLHVPPEEARLVPDRLRDWLTEHRITVADLPTTLAEALLAMPDQPAFLRLLLTGGDRLTAAPRPGLPYALINAYGPTEATVTATWAEIGSSARLPGIGRPIPGLVARVLDGRLRPVPAGVPGELYLGGTGLALGYLNRPELTADRFGPDPYGRAGDRLYRTGDLVRRAADGSLEFLGRTDAQIKLRGYRIEPGEIAAALRRLPGIRQAHVAVLGAGGQASLVGYLVPEPGAPEPLGQAELRERLAATLPGYMVPSSYCWLETLPMTRNGKIDPARLPAPQLAEQPAGRAARRGTEQQLAEIWQQVLGVPRVGADDNFFDLGGHSLLLGRVHQRITAELRPDLPLITLFRYPTVAALARHLDAPAGTVRPADRDRPGSTQPNGRGAEPNGRADSSVGRADSSVGRAEGRDRLSRLRARR
jgi:amino acid adenylation domain-containing protein